MREAVRPQCCGIRHIANLSEALEISHPERDTVPCSDKGVQTMEQIVIAYKKIREAARLLAAANERALADVAEALAKQVERKNVQ